MYNRRLAFLIFVFATCAFMLALSTSSTSGAIKDVTSSEYGVRFTRTVDDWSTGRTKHLFRPGAADGVTKNAVEPTEEVRTLPHTQEGSFVSSDSTKLLMMNTQGEENLIPLAEDVHVTCDGRVCSLSQLWSGIMIRVTTRNKIAIRIDAIDSDAEHLW
jgi:hypothetical protein